MCGIYSLPQMHINCSCTKCVNLTIRITKETHLDHILVLGCLAGFQWIVPENTLSVICDTFDTLG